MHDMNLRTCGDLQAIEQQELIDRFGKFGQHLYSICRGIDQREVITEHKRKSLSVEETYPTDLPNLNDCLLEIIKHTRVGAATEMNLKVKVASLFGQP